MVETISVYVVEGDSLSKTFKAGELVQLKSGGPPMTVTAWSEYQKGFECVWFKGASKEKGYFPSEILMPYVAPKKDD